MPPWPVLKPLPEGENHIGIVSTHAMRENRVSGTTTDMTGTAEVDLIAAPGAGYYLAISHLSAINSHATVDTWVTFKDGASGTIKANIFCKAAGGGAVLTFPDALMLSANTKLVVANVTTGANVRANAAGRKEKQ